MLNRPVLLYTPILALVAAVLGACSSPERAKNAGSASDLTPGTLIERRGEEMMVAGQLFHVGTPVVLWTDPGGYDAYRTEYRFDPFEERKYDPERKRLLGPQRYNLRDDNLTPEQLELVRGGGWPLDLLREQVDQFVLHYDVCGTSMRCFRVLHDIRGLSVHFMLDIDGTIYQTLDLKERAWHASQANDRSIGIEIAHIGAYPPGEKSPLDDWYTETADGSSVITLPDWLGDGGVRTPGFVGRPDRPGRIAGQLHGRTLEQPDFTPEQYESLIKLTAALARVFPKMEIDYPRNPDGSLRTSALTADEWRSFQGIVGHFHLTEGKIDPGPAMQWERLVREARALIE